MTKKKKQNKLVIDLLKINKTFSKLAALRQLQEDAAGIEPHIPTKAEKAYEKRKNLTQKKAEALIRKFLPVYKKLEKNDLIDAKDLLHEILGINCDCYHSDW